MRRDGTAGADRPRRFYESAVVVAVEGGFTVQLDDRRVKTPAGSALVVPTRALAQLLADEWAAQSGRVDPAAMPANRLAATVIDRTSSAPEAVSAEVARYAGSDVLCYFAEAPDALVGAERQAWRPWLRWADEALGVALQEVAGIAPRPQPSAALARVEALVMAWDPFTQAGVAYATALYGSAILALAVQAGRLDASGALEVSRVDEVFQAQRWGVDDEAAERLAERRRDAALVGRWLDALRG